MCFLALLGIILMIIENEINFEDINYQQTIISWSMKMIISITTIILVILVICYNRLNLEMYALNNSLGSWRVGLTNKKIILILLEILVCSIHPFPRYPTPNQSTSPHASDILHIETDVALGLPSNFTLFLND